MRRYVLLAGIALLAAACGDEPQGRAVDTAYGSIVYYCDYKHGNLVYLSKYHESIAVVKEPSCAR